MTPHLLAYALSTPWAMMPERMTAYAALLASHYAGRLPPPRAAEPSAEAQAEVQAAALRNDQARASGIAVVVASGAIVEWPNQIDMCDGGTSSRQLVDQLNRAAADDSVGQILHLFATPGGSVYGMTEWADAINAAKAKKPVIGVAQSLAASAGYWALSQCTEAYCSPSGEVGSIGVYSAHEDISKALELAGIKVELFSAGKYKTEGHPFGPMSDEAKAYQTERAADYYGMFTKAVAKGRRVPIDAVRGGMGEGRVLGAQQALEANMIDGVMSVDEVLANMQRTARGTNRRSAMASRRAFMATL